MLIYAGDSTGKDAGYYNPKNGNDGGYMSVFVYPDNGSSCSHGPVARASNTKCNGRLQTNKTLMPTLLHYRQQSKLKRWDVQPIDRLS